MLKLPLLVLLSSITALAGTPTPAERCKPILAAPAKGDDAEVAQLRCFWDLKWPRTFVEAWFQATAKKSLPKSRAFLAFAKGAAPQFASFLETEAILFTAEQEKKLKAFPWSEPYSTWKAWASLRKGLSAGDALQALPKGHAWRPVLVRSVVLAQVRRGKPVEGARLLQTELRDLGPAPADHKALASYSLQLARLKYQAGDLDAAAALYEAIPNGSGEFRRAREELLWVWLRRGDVERLRGTLATFETGVFDDKPIPEVHVLRALSNLKLCHYDEAQKNLAAFIDTNLSWVKRAEAASSAESPEAPPEPDWYVQIVSRAEASRAKEQAALKAWGRSEQVIALQRDTIAKVAAKEYRRQWRGYLVDLRDAVTKMRFVKIELMKQLQDVSKWNPESPESESKQRQVHASLKRELDEEDMAFPYDGVVWPDELFRLKSDASNRCL